MLETLKKLPAWQAMWLAALFAAVTALAGLEVRSLESGDETRVAGIAAEIACQENWLIPRLNGKPFLEYPPLYYWAAAGSCKIFGIDEFAVKLPSALAAFGCGLIVFFFALRLRQPPWAALLATVMLCGSSQFFGNSRKCMVDMLLAFFILYSVYAFFCGQQETRPGKKLLYCLLFSSGVCGGVYTKGLIGAVLPLAVLGSWLAVEDFAAKKFRISGYLRLGAGTMLALAGVGVWYALIRVYGGEEMFNTVFFTNNLGRFSGSQGDHVEPFYYYLEKLPQLFWPWLPLLPFALFHALRKFRRLDPGMRLVLCFLLVPFALLTISAGKRMVYLLPLYAPCALLCAWSVAGARFELFSRLRARFLSGRTPLMVAAGVLAAALAGMFYLSLSSGPAAVIYPAAAGMILIWTVCVRRPRAILWLGTLLVALFFVSLDTTSEYFHNDDSLESLFAAANEIEREGGKVAFRNAPERTRGGAYFYLSRSLPEVSPGSANTASPTFFIIRDKKNLHPGARRFGDSHWLLPPQ